MMTEVTTPEDWFRSEILRAMEEAGLSQSQLAALAGYPRGHLNAFLRGRAKGIQYRTFLRLMKAAGVQVDMRKMPIPEV